MKPGIDLIGDMVELIARAVFGGLAAAVAMSLAILALSASAQADPPASETNALPATPPWSVAPAPEVRTAAAGTGALWATAAAQVPKQYEAATRVGHGDDEGALDLLLGLAALSTAAVAAVVGLNARSPDGSPPTTRR